MGRVTIHNIDFHGDFGKRLPAWCETCGFTTIAIPFSGMEALTLSSTSHNCGSCGQKIYITSAHYEFFEDALNVIRESNITRRSARRFLRKTKKAKNLSLAFETLERTDPSTRPIIQEIKGEPDWNLRVAIASTAIVCALSLPGAIEDWKDFLGLGVPLIEHANPSFDESKEERDPEAKPLGEQPSKHPADKSRCNKPEGR